MGTLAQLLDLNRNRTKNSPALSNLPLFQSFDLSPNVNVTNVSTSSTGTNRHQNQSVNYPTRIDQIKKNIKKPIIQIDLTSEPEEEDQNPPPLNFDKFKTPSASQSPFSPYHYQYQCPNPNLEEQDQDVTVTEDVDEFDLVYKRPRPNHRSSNLKFPRKDNQLQSIISRITTGHLLKLGVSTTTTRCSSTNSPNSSTPISSSSRRSRPGKSQAKAAETVTSSSLSYRDSWENGISMANGLVTTTTNGTPGSRLSMIATSLPKPKMINVAHLINSCGSGSGSTSGNSASASNYNYMGSGSPGSGSSGSGGSANKRKASKPVPALSPISRGRDRSLNVNPNHADRISISPKRKWEEYGRRQHMSMMPQPQTPIVVNISTLSPPSSSSRTSSAAVSPLAQTQTIALFDTCDSSLPAQSDEKVLVQGMLQPGKKNQNKIKRPLNAFMVWSKLQRRKIMDNDPTVHHSLISKQLGADWKALSQTEREPFYQEAKRLGEIHNQIYPDYKYQPRRKDRQSGQATISSNSKNGQSDNNDLHYPINFYVPPNVANFEEEDEMEMGLDLSMKSKSTRLQLQSQPEPEPDEDDWNFEKVQLETDENNFDTDCKTRTASADTSSSQSAPKKGYKNWTEVYEDSEKSDDEDRLVIDE